MFYDFISISHLLFFLFHLKLSDRFIIIFFANCVYYSYYYHYSYFAKNKIILFYFFFSFTIKIDVLLFGLLFVSRKGPGRSRHPPPAYSVAAHMARLHRLGRAHSHEGVTQGYPDTDPDTDQGKFHYTK